MKKLLHSDSFTLYLIAAIPLTMNILMSFSSMTSSVKVGINILITVLCLLLDAYLHKDNPNISIFSIVAGVIFIPFYLLYRKSENDKVYHGPLITWIVLFSFFLATFNLLS